MQFIDLHKQYKMIEKEVNSGLKNVLDHKHFISGPEVAEFERMLAEYTGRKHVIACASGTDALTVPLMAMGIKKNDAVFVPSFTFFASAESVTLAGGTPVFVDSDPKTFNISVDSLEKTIKAVLSEGKLTPKGIIPVDLFGLPAEHERIAEIAKKYNLFVLEDAAQGFGGEYKGQRACSFGNVSATSFFPAKPLGCYGDGGAIFTDDDEIANIIKSVHVHGQGSDKYDNVRIGLNSRLDTMQAVVLIEKLKLFPQELKRRNEVADLYRKLLEDVVETPITPENYLSSWAQFTCKAKNESQRSEIIKKMGEKDIPIMVYYPIPAHLSTAYKNEKMCCDDMSSCESLSKTVFSLPMHPYLEDKDVELIVNELKNIVK